MWASLVGRRGAIRRRAGSRRVCGMSLAGSRVPCGAGRMRGAGYRCTGGVCIIDVLIVHRRCSDIPRALTGTYIPFPRGGTGVKPYSDPDRKRSVTVKSSARQASGRARSGRINHKKHRLGLFLFFGKRIGSMRYGRGVALAHADSHCRRVI